MRLLLIFAVAALLAALAGPAAAATGPSLLLLLQRQDVASPTLPATYTRFRTVQFLFGLDDARLQATAPVVFTCSVDGMPAFPCTSPLQPPSLADGDHTVTVTAAAAATATTPLLALTATAAVHVDATAPVLTWLSVPALVINQPGAAAFTAGAGEAVFFECSLDGAAYAPCGAAPGSPADTVAFSLAPAAAGPHTGALRAFDVAGNAGAPIVFAFSSDPCVAAGACLPSVLAAGVPQCGGVDDGLYLDVRNVHICRRCRALAGCTPNPATPNLRCSNGVDSVCNGNCASFYDPANRVRLCVFVWLWVWAPMYRCFLTRRWLQTNVIDCPP
jgi:hypothetical protein